MHYTYLDFFNTNYKQCAIFSSCEVYKCNAIIDTSDY